LWFLSAFFLAKRSLSHTSQCQDACTLLTERLGLTRKECRTLQRKGLVTSGSPRNGCWMDRKVHSLVWLVVDALRFDFALYDLPRSLGTRFSSGQLLQFVADPPTVTMQRLKALTTGGLPTFADFSSNVSPRQETRRVSICMPLSHPRFHPNLPHRWAAPR
jgi:phosphatidylinositol glycan class O